MKEIMWYDAIEGTYSRVFVCEDSLVSWLDKEERVSLEVKRESTKVPYM